MTFGRLLLRNLFYHWRGNLAVLLGVVVGTAVLTGALLVGDSLRGSLRDVAARQLGNIDHVLVGGHLIRQEVAEDLQNRKAAERVVPALVLQGAVGKTQTSGSRAAILGVGPTFWRLWPGGRAPLNDAFWKSDEGGVVLNRALADDLKVGPGDAVRVSLLKASAVPRESILGHKDAGDVLDDVKLTVKAVLPDDAPGARFSLTPSPSAPRNAYIPLATVQKELTRGKRHQPALLVKRPINALLVEGGTPNLQASLHLKLEDWGLVLRDPRQRAEELFAILRKNRGKKWWRLQDENFARQVTGAGGKVDREKLIAYFRAHHNYLSLESRQLFLQPAEADAAMRAAKKNGLTAAPTLVYLADSIAAGKGHVLNYAVVAALDPKLPAPLGRFLPPGVKQLGPDEIVLTQWQVPVEKKGKEVTEQTPIPRESGVKQVELSYYGPEESDNRLYNKKFRVAGWIPVQGAADDPDLAPEFPGITDQLKMQDWDPPTSLHYDENRVTPLDESYWEVYRATPKAYVSLATGQKLWGSRFGNLTSVRLARPGSDADLAALKKSFEDDLLADLKPEQGGLVFDAVRRRAMGASAGSNDFGMLFLGFSIFIIAAALLLVGLLFRLNLERRAAEVGLLLAAGLGRRRLRWLLLGEGTLLAAVGGVLGCAGAVGYAWLLLDLLRSWWPGGLEQSFLQLHFTAASFLIGYFASLLVSVLTIAWSARVLSKVSPRALLAGETSEPADLAAGGRPGRWRLWVGGLSLVFAVACVAYGFTATDHEARAGSFFGSGFLLLVAGLIAVWSYLRRDATEPSRHVATLGVRNASRHPGRSLLTVGLLAAAVFLVVAVESFHRDPGQEFATKEGGSGGFDLLAELDVPLFWDLHTLQGRDDLRLAVQQGAPGKEDLALKDVTYYSFRFRPGDDASCLNLAQPRRPRLLGVPPSFIDRGGFRFGDTEAQSAAEKANPWLLLDRKLPDAVPVLGDATTVTWTLKSGLGKTLTVPDENGRPVKLRIVGLLEDSIFQSELLMSGANFRKLYPHQEGYKFILIDSPPSRMMEVRGVLQTALADHGVTVLPTRQRLETYLAVENTYLLTFQALGGLGLLLGALGLAVILLRSVWERRGELALLRALGYRRSTLGWLVLAENSFLLVLGVVVGIVAALVAVAPPLATGTGEVPWLRLAVLVGLVLAVGLLAGAAAVASTLRAPLLPALRRE